MENQHVITFQLSKKKKRGLHITAFVSPLLGLLILWLSRFVTFGTGRGMMILIGGVFIFISIFSLVSIYYLAKEKYAAMYISDEGIIDISTGNRVGTVLWKDVDTIKIMDDLSNLKQKYIVLKVNNPSNYIERESNRSKRRSLELRFQYYGSPICFSNRALDCSFEELKEAVYTKYNAYKALHKDT